MTCKNPGLLRNIGIIAHIDAGKTTLSERILFYCQKIHKLGEVHDGAATMDFLPEEQERGITITSACITCQWGENTINLIDTPGHVDFTMEVERCLRVLDGAVGVFCAVGGVEPQSETVWNQSEQFQVPKLAFINKMDREGANFEEVVNQLNTRLSANAVPLVIPIGCGSTFSGVLDLVNEQRITFDPASQGQIVNFAPFDESDSQAAKPWREKLLETLADVDDDFLAIWLEGNFSVAKIIQSINRSTRLRLITPVLCGAALRNIGVQPLLDAICRYLPSPSDVPPVLATLPDGNEKTISSDPDNYPVGLVFKVVMEKGRKNAFVRLYSGKLHEGETFCNARTRQQDRIGRIYRLLADRREQLDELRAGDIAAIVGLRDAKTGDTYCPKDHLLHLEPINAYAPVITVALEPANADEGKILDEALFRYSEEDPTLKFVMDEETGLRVLSGMGELHLDVVMERLNREYKIQPRMGQPQVVLRETVQKPASAHAIFDRELGKEHHIGEVEVEISPQPRNTGTAITDFLPQNEQEARKILPLSHIEAVREGIKDGLQSGVISGWPLTDIHVHIKNIIRKEGQTTLPGLRMAAGQALREAIISGDPVNLEPIMQVEITTPEDFLGSIISLFNQTGGQVENLEDRAGIKLVSGTAPMRKMFGFSTRLRSASQGRAGFTLSFKTFDCA